MSYISYEQVEQRVIYLRGYYAALSQNESDKKIRKIYEDIFARLAWITEKKNGCVRDNNDKT